MKESLRIKIIETLAALLAAALLFAQIPAAAFPNVGAMRPQHPQTTDPRAIVGQGFSELLGRDLNRHEENQVNEALQQLSQMNERPQKASWAYDLWSQYEVLPVICLFGKVSGKIPSLGSVAVDGMSVSYEFTPCLVLNSINPLALRLREFKSYFMQGGSFSQVISKYGSISAGFLIGLYAGPKNLSKPLIGTYGFVRYTMNKGLVKAGGQIAYSDNNQMLAFGAVGGELSFESILQTFKILPKLEHMGAPTPNPGWVPKGEVGMYFSVKEFPWFERLFIQRMNPVAAFSDFEQYLAANN